MKAIIMAGGEGSRLRPLTAAKPKPMVPVFDKPIMEHIVALLAKNGISEIGATLMYLPEQIRGHFRFGEAFGVSMSYFLEGSPLGTAGSVKNAQTMLDGAFLVISGDALTDIDLRAMMDYHKAKRAAVTIALKKVETPLEYGVVITDEEGRVKKFLEKPSWSQVFSNLANTGVYIIERRVLDFIPEGRAFDFSKDLFPLLLKMGEPLYGHVTDAYWCDIGNIKQYMQAHYDALNGKVAIDAGVLPRQGIWLSPQAEVAADAVLEAPLFVGQGAKICSGARVSGSVIGAGTLVEENASVKKSVLWRNCLVGRGAQLRGCVCGNNVQIHSHAAIFQGAAIGDRSSIGEYATVDHAAKIWPEKTLEKLGHLRGNLIWADAREQKIFGSKGIRGHYQSEAGPALALDLGRAYASWAGKNKRILLGYYGGNAGKALKAALAAGLAAGGCEACDGLEMSLPACRYALWSRDFDGGIYAQAVGEEARFFCLDGNGAYLNHAAERKIENILHTGDFPPQKAAEAGRISPSNWIGDEYLLALKSSVLPARGEDFSVAAASPNRLLLGYLAQMAGSCGGRLLTAPVHEQNADLSALSRTVKENACLFGVYIEADGEGIQLFDERGESVSEALLWPLLAFLNWQEENGGPEVVMPQTATRAVELLAGENRNTVVRAENLFAARLGQSLAQVAPGDEKAYFQANLFYDGVLAATRLARFLQKRQTPLSLLLGRLPS
ncbi:MAG: sugar phosphate nucleotidyltransferase, partial [Clostridiales bacterium]|nr:sugar phosphate nucleotidyltransferase [Clostridiales bacterium]